MVHSANGSAKSRLVAMAKLGCAVSATSRSAARESAICRAVVDLLNETSYESITMDAVASRAKASKATIYRRWTNKDELVIHALRLEFQAKPDVVVDTGSLREDLLSRLSLQLCDPATFAAHTAGFRSLLYAGSNDPVLAGLIRECMQETQMEALQTILGRAHLRGELRRPVRAGLVWEVAQAQFCSRSSIDPGEFDQAYISHIVDDVLLPIICHAGAANSSVATLGTAVISTG